MSAPPGYESNTISITVGDDFGEKRTIEDIPKGQAIAGRKRGAGGDFRPGRPAISRGLARMAPIGGATRARSWRWCG